MPAGSDIYAYIIMTSNYIMIQNIIVLHNFSIGPLLLINFKLRHQLYSIIITLPCKQSLVLIKCINVDMYFIVFTVKMDFRYYTRLLERDGHGGHPLRTLVVWSLSRFVEPSSISWDDRCAGSRFWDSSITSELKRQHNNGYVVLLNIIRS